MNRLNNITDKKELEKQLKMLHTDISFGSSLPPTLEEKISEVKRKCLIFSQSLNNQIALRPSANKMVSNLRQEIEEMANHFEKNKESLCENPIVLSNDAQFLDSILIKPDVVTTLFKNWLPSQEFTLKLLYRGSKDGYSGAAFHQKCDNIQHTISMIATNYGKTIGGYSDQTWNATGGYKTSSNSFLFSITDKEVYPLVNVPNHNAIYARSDYGPTFGDNHEFYISNNCNIDHTSYTWLGNTYDPKGKSREQIGGFDTFNVMEIEVFAVQFS
jgi:hypothetical protein